MLRGEAPGVSRLKFRRRWTTLARVFGLPPPSSMQRARPAIEALFVIPRGEQLEVIALVGNDLGAPARARAEERMAAARTALGAAGRALEFKLLDLNSIDEAAFQLILTLGSLLAGSAPAIFFNATHMAARAGAPIAAGLAECAPTPLSTLALMLLLGAPPVSPLEVARKALAARATAHQLANPSDLCARWAAAATGHEELLLSALRWSQPAPRHGEPLAAREVMRVGRELAMLCARAVHRLPRAESRALRIRLHREVIGPGLPRALLPALGQCKLRLSGTPLQVGRNFEVRSQDGAVLGRGHTGVQARVRALALATAAGLAAENKLAARLARPHAAPTLHLLLETYEVPGPPFDPLNRGPDRQLGLLSSTALLLRQDARPTAFDLDPEETVMRLCNDCLRGREIEVVPQTPDGQPAAARLTRVASLLQKRGAVPAAIEAGGKVLLPRADRMRRVELRGFARRPVICSIDPEAFDLSLSPERGARTVGGAALPGAINCRVVQSDFDPAVACVLSHDDRGRLLREEVPLDRLEDHLREGQEMLRACNPPAPIASRLADGVETLLLRHRRSLPSITVALGGDLPFGLWAEIAGERVQLSRPGGWAAAAQALLASMPVGDEQRIRIVRADITERGAPATPIARLYARAMVLRRLALHLKKQLALIDR